MASSYKSIRDIDWPLLLITLAICGARGSADLQRDPRDEVARCVVEADRLDRRRLSSFGLPARSTITRCWARLTVMYGLSIAGLIGDLFHRDTWSSGRGAGFRCLVDSSSRCRSS